MYIRKKWGLAWIGLLGAFMLLAGCGSNSDGIPTAPATSEQSQQEVPSVTEEPPAASEEESASTRIFPTVKGDIAIPANPKRVVTDYYGGELIAAGLNVVGVAPITFDNPFLKESLQNTEDAGQPLNVEKILTLKPDLIVVMYDQEYEALSKIAPTVHIPFNTVQNVRETITLFSDLAGTPDQGKQLLEQFEQKAQTAREVLKPLIGEHPTVGIYELVNDGSLWIFGDNAGRGGQVFYSALGLSSPHPDPAGEQTLQLSMELLPEYAGDYMFLTVYDPENTGEAKRTLENSSIWQSLPAYQNKQIFINDYNLWYPNDPLAIMGQIDLAVELLQQQAE